MNQFDIQPLAQFAGSSAAIRRPKEIAYFSYDDNHEFHLDERSLRYYYTPRIGADLSKGFDTFEQIDDSADDHLDGLLKTIIDLEKRTGTKCEADIVTWRGMMTKIMATPFDNFDGFEMNATRFQDTIFIEENHAHKLASRREQHQRQHRQPATPGSASQDVMSYWGYKFETLSLLPQPWDRTSREFIEGREDMVVRNYAQYCSVVKTGIGRAKLIIGGEVDAVWDCKPAAMTRTREHNEEDDVHPHPHPHPQPQPQQQQQNQQPINYVELKTTADPSSSSTSTSTQSQARTWLKYERKLLKFWIQSFLLGVPRIVIGFRSPDGILLRVEEMETRDLPSIVKKNSGVSRGGNSVWDGNVCINFTAGVLEWLKRTVVGEGVWRIRRREGGKAIEVFKVEEGGTGDLLGGGFVEWRLQKQREKE